MAWRFWPVVDLILVATFETEVRSEGSALSLQARSQPDYKERPIEDAAPGKAHGTALIGLDLYKPPYLTIGMRLHGSCIRQPRACLRSKSTAWPLSTMVVPSDSTKIMLVSTKIALSHIAERDSNAPKGPRQDRGVKSKLCWCGTTTKASSLRNFVSAKNRYRHLIMRLVYAGINRSPN